MSSEQDNSNLEKLLSQHWQHGQHVENERAQFMQVYAAIIGGIIAVYGYLISTGNFIDNGRVFFAVSTGLLMFVIILTFLGFFLTLRWIQTFEFHRHKVNLISKILSPDKKLDLSMTIPSIKTPLIGKLFKTRYVLPVFYLLLLALFTGVQIWDIVAVSFFTQVFIWRFIIKSALILVTLVLLAVAVPLAAGGFKAISRTDKTIKKVVVAGCKGEWAQQQYLPYLLNKAVKGEIELWGVDRGDKYETDSQGIFSKKWAAAENCGRVRYLNIADKHFNALIPNEIDLVFVLTPDDTHCSTAEFWFPRLSEEGKIYIEKPLDVKIEDAQRLFAQAGSTAKIFGFDHYLVRIRPLLKKINALAMANGGVKSLAIHILEPNPVKKNRTETLKHGVIFDLYSHVLAVLPALLTEDKAKIAWKINDIEINEVKSLKYAEWQYKSETWARIQLKLDDIEGEAEVGKGVAKLDKHLKIIFRNNKSKYFNLAKNAKARLIKTYLEAVLQGNKAEDIPGVLDSNAAFEILKKLVETKNKSNIAGVYNNTGDKPDSQL